MRFLGDKSKKKELSPREAYYPHWFLCNPADVEGKCGNTLETVLRSALEIAASDDLRFALWDQTPGRDVFYIVDPQTVSTRSAWVVHLRDIQRMQQQLLMALEDPTRFASTSGTSEHWDWELSGIYDHACRVDFPENSSSSRLRFYNI
ncbi:unnamed protein product [Dibothriocephalus latus]|uniref:Uncharacterized protein n=1 Tax=Dibothriocephalus latus TaxID=60516 RepID=A0A3P7MRF1_DIBLA|nr:unnamed protein product [Dibothriocephalus latus]